MKLGTGIHPKHWHWGAWVLLVVLAAVALLLTHRPSGGTAFAAELAAAPADSTSDSDFLPPPDDTGAPPPDATTAPDAGAESPSSVKAAAGDGNGYVAEIVDSSYTVGPAEFFALDLPTKAPGAHATHLFGTVTTAGKKDIMVRLFKSADYDKWLKIKSGRKPLAFYTSPRSHSLTLDQDLPPEAVVLLLDNGYSIRTSKKVTCQLQLRYERGGAMDEGGNPIATPAPKPAPSDDNLPTPRSNTDNEMPPPPPPPPSGD